jgi:predicted metal-dependent peptidase
VSDHATSGNGAHDPAPAAPAGSPDPAAGDRAWPVANAAAHARPPGFDVAPAPDDAVERVLARVARGLRQVIVPFPYLAALVGAARVALDARVPTMGVFASGRMIVNPQFAARLTDADLRFVLAHELLHLALRTHERARGADTLRFNQAHDYIINDVLRAELGVTRIPAGGLDMAGARLRSAEALLLELRDKGEPAPRRMWRLVPAGASEGGGAGGGADSDAIGNGPADGDILDDALEREWFGESAAQQRAQQRRARNAAVRGLALARAGGGLGALEGVLREAGLLGAARGSAPGGDSSRMQSAAGLHFAHWQPALQRWLEAVAMGARSYARPSRRGELAGGLVQPGRRREGWLLNLVLDTSGSMTDVLPAALGAIARFADAAAVDQVRIVQCDAAVTADACVDPAALADFQIDGFGGSDLAPAIALLAADPTVRAAIIVTDGDIGYPHEAPPYEVLWVLAPVAGAMPSFQPPYGQVVILQAGEAQS